MKTIFFFCIVLILSAGCDMHSDSKPEKNSVELPMASGDEKAIALAKRVEEASGGRENWIKVHYISFDYFGSRYWFWDKFKNRYRVESEKRKFRIAGSLDGSETHLWLKDKVETNPDSISKFKDYAYKAWINDTYWLIAPLKLLDEGVHLHYVGDCVFDSTHHATCIELTFAKVGVTPDNKYRMYIDTNTNQVVYWDFYEHKTDTVPTLSNPWTDYRDYSSIKLAGGRGDERGLEDIKLHDQLPDQIFKDVTKSFKDIGMK